MAGIHGEIVVDYLVMQKKKHEGKKKKKIRSNCERKRLEEVEGELRKMAVLGWREKSGNQ